MERIKAEFEYYLWVFGWRKYCLPCDKIYWGWRGDHRECHCGSFWFRN